MNNPMMELVQGKIEVYNQEKIWKFKTEKIWNKGTYTIQVSSRLEDPSGNNLNGLFDHKIGSINESQEGKILELEFNTK